MMPEILSMFAVLFGGLYVAFVAIELYVWLKGKKL